MLQRLKAILRLVRLATMVLPWMVAAGFAGGGSQHRLTDLTAIPLQSGFNDVPAFAPDGRNAMVALGWRDNGNAYSYHLMLILMRPAPGSPWNVVSVAPSDGSAKVEDVVTDSPHTGEDTLRSFRLARGKVDGEPATLLLVATRETGSSTDLATASPVTFEVFRLVRNHGDIGVTQDFFGLLQKTRSTTKFCNADIALIRQYGLPPRAGDDASSSPDGC
jgi:hypothetical protein